MKEIAFRQVHLDFHTSAHIPDVAVEFDAEEFASTMKNAFVNSVTCFARCHHGYLYYNSKLNPERIHPNLKNINFLASQIEALRSNGIRVPIYTTIQWDEYASMHYPEWHVIGEHGEMSAGLYEASFYRDLCVNSPYRDFLKAHIGEIFELFTVTGLFLDIVKVVDCSCRWCRVDMRKKGLNPANKDERMIFAVEMMKGFKDDMSLHIRSFNKNCEIFYNQGHISPDTRESIHNYSHIEVESLPTGQWGYGHFPTVVRYARTLGHDFLGMTGKFHTDWGDVHSFKNQAALEFEVFHILAMNGKCSIGDQLHPNGKISAATYEMIRDVYSQVVKVEPWCKGAIEKVDIGVFNPEEFRLTIEFSDQAKVLHGVTKILVEGGHQFNIIDTKANFNDYKLLILPDEVRVDEKFDCRLQMYVEQGGKLLVSHKSGLTPKGNRFSSDLYGVNFIGDAPFSPDYILPNDIIGKSLKPTEHVMYLQGLQVDILPGSKMLCKVIKPYFNRTWEHYCSHKHTPSSGEFGYPGVIKNQHVIYFAHPVFNQYVHSAPIWVKHIVLDAIDQLLPEVTLRHNGPSSLITAVNLQQEENRAVVHLLHYIPESKSDSTLIIEDIIPLHDISLSLKFEKPILTVKKVPEGEVISHLIKDGRVELTLNRLNGYQLLELKFE